MSRRSTALSALALSAAFLLPGSAIAQDKPLDREAVEAIVREYILSHPEIITEAIQVLQQREEEAQRKAVSDAIAANREELERSKTSPVIGNPKGDVTLVEFFDYNCPYCRQAKAELKAALEEDKGVRVVLKEFPILGPGSTAAARAALAAQKQGKYAAFHDALMSHPGRIQDEATVFQIAEETGLDMARLKTDMEAADIQAELDANAELAAKLGVRGTPAFVIGDTLIPSAVDRATFTSLFDIQRTPLPAAKDAKGADKAG